MWTHHADDLNRAADRNWLLMRQLYYAQSVVVLGDGRGQSARNKLRRDVAAARAVRGKLYFGLTARPDDVKVMRLTKAQARLLFGPSGVDARMLRWLRLCDDIATQRHMSRAQGEALIAALFAIFGELMAGLDASYAVYEADALRYHAVGRGVAVALVALSCALVVGLYFGVIAPSVRNLVKCGEGTEDLLRGLPDEMVRKVPALAAYLQISGSEAVEVPLSALPSAPSSPARPADVASDGHRAEPLGPPLYPLVRGDAARP